MSDHSKIEWTDSTWPVTTGCTHISPGCDGCYAAALTSGRLRNLPEYAGLAERGKFTGEVRLLPERLDWPLKWRRPRRVFVASMSDLFHDAIPDDYIARVFAVMAATPRHTYQVLTKRHGRMRSLLSSPDFEGMVRMTRQHSPIPATLTQVGHLWPLPNVWLGVSVEDQKWADVRVPALLDTPAAVRFLSCEPLLGPVDLTRWLHGGFGRAGDHGDLHWVIVGGESGPEARPMTPTWARQLRDDCTAAGVAFLHKQWGEWSPGGSAQPDGTRRAIYSGDQPAHEVERDTAIRAMWTFGGGIMTRRGKKAAGRLLDGRTWDEYPEVRHAAVT